MSYATPLEARIAKKVTKAITEYDLIEDGDRIMVGLSGGKDSWALMQVLDVLQKRAPIRFSLDRRHGGSGYNGYRHDLISRTCEAAGLGVPDRAHRDRRDDRRHPRSERDALLALCPAAPRRPLPDREGSRRHQDRARPSLDDFVETLLLNLFFPARSRRCRRGSCPTTVSTS